MLLGLYTGDVQVVHKLAGLVTLTWPNLDIKIAILSTSNISKTVLVDLHLQLEVEHAVSKRAIFNDL